MVRKILNIMMYIAVMVESEEEKKIVGSRWGQCREPNSWRRKWIDVGRAVLTNGYTGHVPRAPGFLFLRGPQLAVVK